MNVKKINPALAARVFMLCALISVFSNGEALAGAPQNNGDKKPITISLSMKRVVVDAKGNEALQDALRIKPGDLVEYTAVYRNRGNRGVSGLYASLPVPLGLEYVKQSGRPSPVEATTDGVKYAAEPLLRTVKDKDGTDRQEEIPYPEYRNLRWDVGNLEPGKRIVVSARMRIIALPKTPEELVAKPATPVLVK